MAITDLTGTTWKFNSTIIDVPELDPYRYIRYYLNYDVPLYPQEGERPFIGLTPWKDESRYPGSKYIDFDFSNGTFQHYTNGWDREGARIIKINGGSDVRNTELITWLTSNAVQYTGVILSYSTPYQAKTGKEIYSGYTLSSEDLNPLTKEGYRFDGWYLDSSLTQRATTGYRVTSSLVLYAKWVQLQSFNFIPCTEGEIDTYMPTGISEFNSNWYKSTNKGINDSVASITLSFSLEHSTRIFVQVLDYQNESSYDYGTISKIDSTSLKWSGNNRHIEGGEFIDYGIVTSGSHTITAKYIKDGSTHNDNDRLYFRIISSKPIFVGSNPIHPMYVGEDRIVTAYVGEDLVYRG